MALLTLRYDMRLPDFAAGDASDRYAACLDQCAWADKVGFTTCAISEHHGVDDGFLPSPLVLAGAIAARTTSMMVTISALLMPFHDPLRLAEDLAVLSLISEGRVGIVAGLGYRDEEFEIFGIDRKQRVAMLEESIDVLRQAWTGEPFPYRGRTARVTPRPLAPPMILVGGSTDAAAKRAARLQLPFMPAVGDPALAEVYRAACAEVGFEHGWVLLPSGPGFVHVSDDPERDWARIARFAQYEAATYHSWQQPGQRSQVHVDASSLDELKASGVYRVVTPDECVALAEELGPMGAIVFHPLMGGMDIDLGWESLQLFEDKVLPRL
ncbi:MAG: hypothetical protein QOG64_1627 [Acidimicrobiaceae bacterium]|jgi:alkanesulfonate monooxygenase SsuD/methylene tetrahydromethanopterin reductase-like flavin-dependent oxidoreductase (luciferase family)|nr:hypothetical protein [Acidimicrobiaceae bacterium]